MNIYILIEPPKINMNYVDRWLFLVCWMNAYGNDCVEDNRRGMNKCMMTGMMYGDI